MFRTSRPRRALRDRNYAEQEEVDKPKYGGKRKRIPNSSIHLPSQKSDSLSSITNFSEFDDYSLVISGSPAQIKNDGVYSPRNLRSQNKIETSTPCAKRTCSANDINNLSVIDHIDDDVPPSPSVRLEQSSYANECLSRVSAANDSDVNNKSKSVFKTPKDESLSSPVIPCIVQLEKLRQSFLSMHVSQRSSKLSSLDHSESLFSTFDENGSSINCVTAESKLEVLDSEEDEEDETDTEEDEESEVRGDDDLSKIFEEEEEEENEDEEENEGGEIERSMTKYMLASPENDNFYSAHSSLASKETPNVSLNKSLLNRSHFVSINLSSKLVLSNMSNGLKIIID